MSFEDSSKTDNTRTVQSGRTLILLVAIFLIVFASRIVRLPTLDMERDEVWSVWQTFGSVQQVISWTPFDWSPAYYLLVDAWQQATGINPFTLRLLSVFAFLLTLALLFHVARKLYGTRAALMTLLVLSALGYILFLSTLLRAYIVLLLFWMLSFWLAIRLVERPSRRLTALLTLSLAAMFYLHVSGAFGIGLIVLCTLILYRRQALPRWQPLIAAGVLCLPEAVSKFATTSHTVNNAPSAAFTLDVLQFRLVNHYLDFFGFNFTLWLVVMLLASVLVLDRMRLQRRSLVLIVWMLYPVLILLPATVFGVFNPRHTPWVMIGFAIWIGLGLSMLPRAALIVFSGLLIVFMFGALPLKERYNIDALRTPLVSTFAALSHKARSGDVILLDPKCEDCARPAPEEWDYFSRVYFPAGLSFVTQPQANRRIWYIAAEGREDAATFVGLQKTHALSAALGDKALLFRLFEAPPDPTGVLFENGLRFHGAELLNSAGLPFAWHEGETVRVRLWWSADRPLTADYSEGTYVLSSADGSTASQFDGPPQTLNGPKETSRWAVGPLYLEEREVKLPYPLDTSEQQLALVIYQWWDGKRIDAPGLTPDHLLLLPKVSVKAW